MVVTDFFMYQRTMGLIAATITLLFDYMRKDSPILKLQNRLLIWSEKYTTKVIRTSVCGQKAYWKWYIVTQQIVQDAVEPFEAHPATLLEEAYEQLSSTNSGSNNIYSAGEIGKVELQLYLIPRGREQNIMLLFLEVCCS